MARETITKANAKDILARYEIGYTETKTGDVVSGGTVKVGRKKEDFTWSKAGNLPGRGKIWLFLRTVPQFANDYPKVPAKTGIPESVSVAPPLPSDPVFWQGHTADQMKAVQKVLGEEIPKREAAERERDIAEGKRLFGKHGVNTPEGIAALFEGKSKPQE